MPRRGPRYSSFTLLLLFFDQKLKCGFHWARLSPFFFRDTMKFPEVYARVFGDSLGRLSLLSVAMSVPYAPLL